MKCLECGNVGMTVNGNCDACGSLAMYDVEITPVTEPQVQLAAREVTYFHRVAELMRIRQFFGGTNQYGVSVQ
jgi:hypothetical protein